MGYYIQTPQDLGKAEYLIGKYGAIHLHPYEALKYMDLDFALICVVNNGLFEAAAFIYNHHEYEAFNDPRDGRPKKWLVMDLGKAKELSGYRR